MRQGALLSRMLVWMKLARLGTRTDEDCNSEIFSITDWKLCHDLFKKFNHSILDSSDIEGILKNWKNTVTVTFRGSVIIRYSWKNSVQWNDEIGFKVLSASKVVCWIVRNIC